MSSCNATSPIDIPTKGNVSTISGTFNCIYDTNLLSGAAVSLSKDLSHLAIQCNTSNSSKVSFYTAGVYIPTEVRIYSPSLHTYNGTRADAELLIVHSTLSSNTDVNISSNGLIVSVPISLGGGSNPDLEAIIQAANTLDASTAVLNSSAPINKDVNVNSFLPSKPFYVYNGTLPYDSCGGNYYYAVFTDPISIKGPINNIVASGIKTVQPAGILQKSRAGPVTGVASNGSDEYVVVEFMDTGDCDNDATNTSLSSLSSSTAASKSFAVGMNVMWGIIISFVLLLIYWFWKRIDVNGTSSVATSGTGLNTNPATMKTA